MIDTGSVHRLRFYFIFFFLTFFYGVMALLLPLMGSCDEVPAAQVHNGGGGLPFQAAEKALLTQVAFLLADQEIQP